MPRHRLGVVVLLPEPLATEVQGVRRGLGDGDRATIPPHLTLVPPVNVHDRDLTSAFDVVRAAAKAVVPFTLALGPATTFHPVTPTVYLAVSGDLDALGRLRDAVFRGPLHRSLEHEFVAHVTLDADQPPDRIPHAVEALASFHVDLTVDRIVVLRQDDEPRPDGSGRAWVPFFEAVLGDPTVVGRGGLPLELAVTGRLDPEAAALLAIDGSGAGRPFAVTARRDDRVVGAAWGWTDGALLELADLAVAAAHRNQGIGRHLLAAVESLGASRGCSALTAVAPRDGAPAAALRGAGWSAAGDVGASPDDRRRWTRSL